MQRMGFKYLGFTDCYDFDPLIGELFDDKFDHYYVNLTIDLTEMPEKCKLTQKAFIALYKSHNSKLPYLLPFQR